MLELLAGESTDSLRGTKLKCWQKERNTNRQHTGRMKERKSGWQDRLLQSTSLTCDDNNGEALNIRPEVWLLLLTKMTVRQPVTITTMGHYLHWSPSRAESKECVWVGCLTLCCRFHPLPHLQTRRSLRFKQTVTNISAATTMPHWSVFVPLPNTLHMLFIIFSASFAFRAGLLIFSPINVTATC